MIKAGGRISGSSKVESFPVVITAPNSLGLAASLGSLSSPLHSLPFDSSPYIFTELIREGRRAEIARRSMLRCCASLAIIFALWSIASAMCSRFLAGPETTQILAAALLSLALIGGPCETQIMRLMPLSMQSVSGQASSGVPDIYPALQREVLQFSLCAMLSTISIFIVSIFIKHNHSVLDSYSHMRESWNVLMGGVPSMGPGAVPSAPLLACIVGVCGSHMHATLPIHEYGPLQNKLWMLSAALFLSAVVIWEQWYHFCISSSIILRGSALPFEYSLNTVAIYVSSFVWYALRIALGFLLGIVGNESIKAFWWRPEVERGVRRAKLHFNTRLGMHSPV